MKINNLVFTRNSPWIKLLVLQNKIKDLDNPAQSKCKIPIFYREHQTIPAWWTVFFSSTIRMWCFNGVLSSNFGGQCIAIRSWGQKAELKRCSCHLKFQFVKWCLWRMHFNWLTCEHRLFTLGLYDISSFVSYSSFESGYKTPRFYQDIIQLERLFHKPLVGIFWLLYLRYFCATNPWHNVLGEL